MKHQSLISYIIGGLCLLLALPLSAQNVVLSGRVTDAETGEPLIGVSVYHTQRRTGTTTNTTGYYTLTLPSNRQMELVFSYVGYASETQQLTLTGDRTLNIALKQNAQNLGEVQVYGTRRNFGAQSSQMSAIAVSAEQIRRMPALFGEADVLKSLQRLPGVQSSGEGRAGIHVRGGDADQNLFSLDGITLYNPEHLQGFTSAINADVLSDVALYKGAFPARYGNRLSSIVDITLQEGDMERYHASVTAGMLASRAQVEGPLWKGHTSFNVAARVSYFSAVIKPMLEEVIYDNPGQMNDFAHMKYYDLNAKLVHRFSDSDKLSAVFYMGRDKNNATPNTDAQEFTNTWKKNGVEYGNYTTNTTTSQTLNKWNNLLGGLLYTHRFSSRLRLDATLSYSGYDYDLSYLKGTSAETTTGQAIHGKNGAELLTRKIAETVTNYHSEVHDLGFKADLAYTVQDRHEVHGGMQAGSIRLKPSAGTTYTSYSKSAPDAETVLNIGLGNDRYEESRQRLDNDIATDMTLKTFAAYIEDDWNLTSQLKTNIGMRLQGYNADGKTHLVVEPRASLRWLLAHGVSLKASYARMSQGMNLLTSGSLLMPSEVWVPITKDMKVGTSDQVSVGYSHDLWKGLQLSAEAYYKWLDNVVDYREGASFQTGNNWADKITQGRGRAYGIELMAQKTIGSTTGMVSYTWSKSLRTFDREGQELNQGEEFYATGDRRHNFSINLTQRLSKNWDFSAAWTYQTGRRAILATNTIGGSILDDFNAYLPQGESTNPALQNATYPYLQDSYVKHVVRMDTYGQRNSYVMPAVHRLDISLSHHGSIGIGEMICDVGIYNLYCQQNVSSVYWGYKNNRRALKGVCLFPLMPFLSLTLKL